MCISIETTEKNFGHYICHSARRDTSGKKTDKKTDKLLSHGASPRYASIDFDFRKNRRTDLWILGRVESAMNLNEGFRQLSVKAANALGSPWLFVINVVLIVGWLATGPLAHFSDTWQLVVNTATTIITYLAVFLIQNTQNRDAKAVHLKLDELISSVAGARNRLVDLEQLSDEEMEELQKQFQELHRRAKTSNDEALRAIKGELDEVSETRPREKARADN
jgi:low affinity Fe/Cu permease